MDGLADGLRFRQGAFDGRGDDPDSERFGEDQGIAGMGCGVGANSSRMDESGDGVAELDLGVAHGMAPEKCDASLPQLFGAAEHDLGQNLQIFLPVGKTGDRQRGQRDTSHSINIAERIGCGYGAISRRDHRRLE